MAGEAYWQWTPDGFRPATSLPLTDRGFRYGLAVFETLRVQDGVACFVAEHSASLARACRESDFPVPGPVLEQAAFFLERNAWPAPAGVARVHVTGGDGGPADPIRDCRVFIAFEPREPPVPESWQRGWKLRVHPAPFTPVFGGRKTHNYWPNVAACSVARAAGCDETLLFDAQERLISASLGNVFVVLAREPSKLLTPPASCGARRGVVREWVLSNFDVGETVIRRDDLAQVAGILISNSWIGLMPAREVESHSLSKGTVSRVLTDRHCLRRGIFWNESGCAWR